MFVCVCSLVKTKDSPFRCKRSLPSVFTVIVFRVCPLSMLISLRIPYCLAFYPPIVFYALLGPYNSYVTDSLHSAKQLDFAWMSRDVWDADLASPIRSRSTKRFWMAVKGIVRILWPGSLQISAQTPRILYIYICCLFSVKEIALNMLSARASVRVAQFPDLYFLTYNAHYDFKRLEVCYMYSNDGNFLYKFSTHWRTIDFTTD